MPKKFIATLFLLPSGLANENLESFIPLVVKQEISKLQHFICEQEKPARQYLKAMGINDLGNIVLYPIHGNADPQEIEAAFEQLKFGKNLGLISDAGLPAIADPGNEVVRRAHEMNVRIVPLPGPGSIFQALMASGLNGQEFVFHGYLPRDKQVLKKRLQDLERATQRTGYTQLFIETPYRNQQLLETILSVGSPGTLLCIASNINASDELILTQSLANWKKGKWDFRKKPCVFVMGKA